ncbi:MAG: RelA/SpoT domain-containing protein [Rhodospirillales bacterium]|nr:RelA/SpoT domain-containing protein [Rhodospirillales bacterium]
MHIPECKLILATRLPVSDILSSYDAWMRGDLSSIHCGREQLVESAHNYPGGSKSRVTKAGANVRDNCHTIEDLAVINVWREAHRGVLNTFQAFLRFRASRSGLSVVVAQRHKRKRTIFDKLRRLNKMELARMDDIAGCRLIFNNLEDLHSFRADVHKAKFRHKLRNRENMDKYDYIKSPKPTGYRGIHDIYEYDVNSVRGRDNKGLFVELQYRTFPQHAWATCVEVIGFVTESQPKFQQGDNRYEKVMAFASEIIARYAEGMKSCFPDIPDADLVREFLALEKELNLLPLLRSLNAANKPVSNKKNAILIFSADGALEIREYRDATDALRELFHLENQNTGKDIVLVRADSSDEVRIAFKNYFSDATEFINLIEYGCQKLSGHPTVRTVRSLRRKSPGKKGVK